MQTTKQQTTTEATRGGETTDRSASKPTTTKASTTDTVTVHVTGTEGIRYEGAIVAPPNETKHVNDVLGPEPTDYDVPFSKDGYNIISVVLVIKSSDPQGTLKAELLVDGVVIRSKEAAGYNGSVGFMYNPRDPTHDPGPGVSTLPAPAPEPSAVSSGSSSPLPDGSCPADFPIKGNANSGIYHVPGGQFYGKTKAEACFATASDAQNAGYRASER